MVLTNYGGIAQPIAAAASAWEGYTRQPHFYIFHIVPPTTSFASNANSSHAVHSVEYFERPYAPLACFVIVLISHSRTKLQLIQSRATTCWHYSLFR